MIFHVAQALNMFLLCAALSASAIRNYCLSGDSTLNKLFSSFLRNPKL
ncbi:MAG: hypothetical protein JWP69_1845 [Flaviaesturariibacter sp.]|nr:hypothetical protein [Flaviaesturariibacter sp.]